MMCYDVSSLKMGWICSLLYPTISLSLAISKSLWNAKGRDLCLSFLPGIPSTPSKASWEKIVEGSVSHPAYTISFNPHRHPPC